MTSRFDGQIVLVAGGTGGLGKAVSLSFVEQGASVVVTFRREEEFAELRRAAGDNGSRLDGQRLDVTDEAAVRLMVDAVRAKHGRLDLMVNCVGAFAGGTKLWETDSKVLDQMLSLNLRSGWMLLRAVTPVMLQQGRGAIVNVASQAAVVHAAGVAAYAASKAAAVAMVDSLAAELAGSGVRVNSILPSIIDTEANRKAMPKADFSKWPKPDQIARVVLFLCSEEAELVHGTSISV